MSRDADALSDAYAAARAVCRRHAKSFHFASYFLPRAKRDHAFAVYAFCRFVDDAVDAEPTPERQAARLDELARTLDAAYAPPNVRGSPARPLQRPGSDSEPGTRPLKRPRQVNDEHGLVLLAFARTVRDCDISQKLFDDLVEGCRMDLDAAGETMRFETWPDLQRYCYHVAGVVGLIMCRVLGLRDASAEANAVAMGNAMQLTNILRDVKEDFARDRVYLPQEDLRRFGVAESDLAAMCDGVPICGAFADLMRFQIARARALYAAGNAGLAALPRDGSRLTAAVMGTVYGGILGAIERADYDVFAARRRLTLPQKLAKLPAAWRLNRSAINDRSALT